MSPPARPPSLGFTLAPQGSGTYQPRALISGPRQSLGMKLLLYGADLVAGSSRLTRQPAGTSLGCANPGASLLCPSLMPDGFSRSCQIGGITRTAMGFVLTSPVSTQAGDTSSVAHSLLARATDKTQPVHGQIPTPPDFNRVWGLGAG